MSAGSDHADVPLLQRPFRTPEGTQTPDIEAYLVALTSAIMEDHSTSTYNILRTHCHDDLRIVDFTLHECGLPPATSLQQHLSNVEALKSIHPHWHVNPFNFSVAMHERLDRAIVWFTSPGSDEPGDWLTNRESVHRVHWRRRKQDDVWEVHMHSSLRGPGNLFSQTNDYGRELEDVPVSLASLRMLYSENELRG